MIEVHELRKRYREIRAVDGVSFTVGERDLVGLLGPNGAGKTTLLRMLAGTLAPDSGDAVLCGRSIRRDSTDAKAAVGYLPENAPSYEELLVVEQLRFAAEAHFVAAGSRRAAVERVAHQCGLEDVMHRPVRELSRGYRQRLGIAQALVHDPPILIFDEPHSGLDPNQMREIRGLLRRVAREKAVILSTHLLGEVEALCERVVLLSQGRVAGAGATQELSGRHSGVRRFRVRVHAPADAGVETALARHSGVQSVELLERGDGGKPWSLEVVLAGGNIEGSVLFDWAVEAGYRLEGLQELSTDLEAVFGELTSSEDGSSDSGAVGGRR